jgi:hypothetical protein
MNKITMFTANDLLLTFSLESTDMAPWLDDSCLMCDTEHTSGRASSGGFCDCIELVSQVREGYKATQNASLAAVVLREIQQDASI